METWQELLRKKSIASLEQLAARDRLPQAHRAIVASRGELLAVPGQALQRIGTGGL